MMAFPCAILVLVNIIALFAVPTDSLEGAQLPLGLAIPIRNVAIPCPEGTTTCGPNRCCLYRDATCCEDGAHCCPRGYRCDVPNKQCVKNSDIFQSGIDLSATSGVGAFVPFRSVNKKEEQSKHCPGGSRRCPSQMSCCLNDDGDWSCCSKPAPAMYTQKVGGPCCNSWYGYICCPVAAPICSIFGCF